MNKNTNLFRLFTILTFCVLSFFVGISLGSHKLEVILGEGALAEESEANFASYWKVWNIIESKSIKEVTDEEKIWGSIKGLTESVGDPYTEFFTPEESQKFLEGVNGKFSGVGMEVDEKDGAIVVVAPLPGSPAEKAGIRSGDIVISIDDISTLGLSLSEGVSLIRGEEGTTVKLGLKRDEEYLDINVQRAVINVPNVHDYKDTENNIYVIQIYSFSQNSHVDFRDSLNRFLKSGTKKLIIDLRDNPGGYLDSAIDMTSWFLPSGKTVVIESIGKEGEKKEYRSRGYNVFGTGYDVVILVNQGSASASEIMAGAMSEHGKATLVGEQTFGKGSVQELIPVTENSSIKITVAKWLTPNGISISEQGLTPDYEVEFTKEDVENGRDPQMEKAIELLNN
ncbi:S41 family peptidase [Candidatus Nomurabacteria bacterium]|nr:S41 family peptidase [Candidatus Nomurabacteria bacterium]